MEWRGALNPNWLKVLVMIAIFLILYFFFMTTIRVRYDCEVGGEECLKEVQRETQRLILQDTLFIGIPLSILAYLFIGFLQSRKK